MIFEPTAAWFDFRLGQHHPGYIFFIFFWHSMSIKGQIKNNRASADIYWFLQKKSVYYNRMLNARLHLSQAHKRECNMRTYESITNIEVQIAFKLGTIQDTG